MAKTEKWEEFLSAECDGSGPHAMLAGDLMGETRRIDTVGGAGAFLCYACYRREMLWRRERNHAVETPFALPEWATLPVHARRTP